MTLSIDKTIRLFVEFLSSHFSFFVVRQFWNPGFGITSIKIRKVYEMKIYAKFADFWKIWVVLTKIRINKIKINQISNISI